jgi:hypothetical protein
VEKEEAVTARAEIGVEGVARRAIGLTALLMTEERWRRARDAVVHRLRLKADIVKLASAGRRQPQCSSERREGRTGRVLEESLARERSYSAFPEAVLGVPASGGRDGTPSVTKPPLNRGAAVQAAMHLEPGRLRPGGVCFGVLPGFGWFCITVPLLHTACLSRLLSRVIPPGSAMVYLNGESDGHVTPRSPALHRHGLYRYYRVRLPRASLWRVLPRSSPCVLPQVSRLSLSGQSACN